MGRLGRIGRLLAGGSALGLITLGGQVLYVRTRRYLSAESAPSVRGTFGEPGAAALRFAVLGDSTAAGVGATKLEETVAGRLAKVLAGTGRRVTLDGLAVSGSRAKDLAPQVSRALLTRPDVALILIGANDATHLTGLADVRKDVAEAVRRLHEAGTAVVVGTCPDMGAPSVFPRPLRYVIEWQGHRVASATRDATESAGGVAVDLAERTGHAMRADRKHTFSSDGFHPSPEGYRIWAEALMPAVERTLTTTRT